MAGPLSVLIGPLLGVLEKAIPDRDARERAQLELLKMQNDTGLREMEAQVQLMLAQTEVNKVEAAAPSTFRAGWRPAVGWVCVVALAYSFFGRQLLGWLAPEFGLAVPEPLDMSELLTLLTGMLGLGSMRSFEKVRRVA